LSAPLSFAAAALAHRNAHLPEDEDESDDDQTEKQSSRCHKLPPALKTIEATCPCEHVARVILGELRVEVCPTVKDPLANRGDGGDNRRGNEGSNQDVLDNVLAGFFPV
jgi:hypothetical protein